MIFSWQKIAMRYHKEFWQESQISGSTINTKKIYATVYVTLNNAIKIASSKYLLYNYVFSNQAGRYYRVTPTIHFVIHLFLWISFSYWVSISVSHNYWNAYTPHNRDDRWFFYYLSECSYEYRIFLCCINDIFELYWMNNKILNNKKKIRNKQLRK